jgi:hypothetical protein
MVVNRKDSSGRSKAGATEQRRRFIETARELGIPDTEAAQERAFGKVGLKKPKKKPQRRKS